MSNPHTGFIVAAYLLALLVIAGIVAAVILDHRAQRRALDKLERHGGGDEG